MLGIRRGIGQVTAQSAVILSGVRRADLSFFLMRVFESLHPADPPTRRPAVAAAVVRDGGLPCARRGALGADFKSITASVALVAWILGHDPILKMMVASYSQDLARLRSNLMRVIMESAWYKADFPGTRISDRGNRALARPIRGRRCMDQRQSFGWIVQLRWSQSAG